MMINSREKQGYSILEILIAIIVLAVLLLIAIPSWSDLVKKKRLISANAAIYDTLQLAHSESTKRKATITVSFSTGSTWCVGLSDGGNCNCNSTGSCLISGVERVVSSSLYPGVSIATTGFTSNSYVQFDGTRGVASNSGNFTLTNTSYQIVLTVNKMGLLSNCSATISGYGAC